ncbi:DCC1-like thiol-disulfide oxidoreductase family protein [Flavobacterium sp. SUN046]|uniref:thiol-disulfide oxidoreductase DCC family protein n=1 Tax=Flavobacterium sp. SUN046 TaxID=3002440 RepID=UPI002DBFE910|nr:DCC1-like thiol-disulfide oxidoreductase family protein [Flavobacterium sp. SUN046]MEC4048714.1 DCC1-like thiol-disulfide oxidoreductase family protein [Flavobacterium sp. SUN046]
MTLPKDKKIVLFDGICNLCDASVQYVIKKDKKDCFRFVSIQSEIGQNILNHLGIDTSKIDSIVLYEPGIAYYTKAPAVIQIAKTLGGISGLIQIFELFPKTLNNSIYDYIARNRYKWYGKKDSCMLPSKELMDKFLN